MLAEFAAFSSDLAFVGDDVRLLALLGRMEQSLAAPDNAWVEWSRCLGDPAAAAATLSWMVHVCLSATRVLQPGGWTSLAPAKHDLGNAIALRFLLVVLEPAKWNGARPPAVSAGLAASVAASLFSALCRVDGFFPRLHRLLVRFGAAPMAGPGAGLSASDAAFRLQAVLALAFRPLAVAAAPSPGVPGLVPPLDPSQLRALFVLHVWPWPGLFAHNLSASVVASLVDPGTVSGLVTALHDATHLYGAELAAAVLRFSQSDVPHWLCNVLRWCTLVDWGQHRAADLVR